MKRYSKCAIYSLEKIEYNDSYFYKATLVENTYNPKIPKTNKWEITFYKCQIYTDLPLETAQFNLGVSPNRLSFDNISNPAHSIIRVLDWEFVNRTAWKGTTQLKTEFGKPIFNQYIAIYSCEFDYPQYKTEEKKMQSLQNKYDWLNEKFNTELERNKELRAKIKDLEKNITKLDNDILKKNEALNDIQIDYNPNYKPKKDRLPTEADMIQFDDIQ